MDIFLMLFRTIPPRNVSRVPTHTLIARAGRVSVTKIAGSLFRMDYLQYVLLYLLLFVCLTNLKTRRITKNEAQYQYKI